MGLPLSWEDCLGQLLFSRSFGTSCGHEEDEDHGDQCCSRERQRKKIRHVSECREPNDQAADLILSIERPALGSIARIALGHDADRSRFERASDEPVGNGSAPALEAGESHDVPDRLGTSRYAANDHRIAGTKNRNHAASVNRERMKAGDRQEGRRDEERDDPGHGEAADEASYSHRR
jgi:hypothetical protein